MKKLFLSLLIIVLQTTLFAAEFEVVSFTKDPSDLSARKFSRKDINDEECALIKVRCDIQGLMFDTNMGVTGLIEYKDGEYWIYVSPYEQILEIFRSGFVKFVYPFNETVEPETVYVLALQLKKEDAKNKTQFETVDDESSKDIIYLFDERDGRKYITTKIVTQMWMAENLNIGKVIEDHYDISNDGKIEKLCYDYDFLEEESFNMIIKTLEKLLTFGQVQSVMHLNHGR